jgi:hypothetical protein
LKKQSQFAAQMNVNSVARKDYRNKTRPGLAKNKAKQSQTRTSRQLVKVILSHSGSILPIAQLVADGSTI